MPRVVHFEIGSETPTRAIEFYKSVFGWRINKWDGPEDYWLVTTGTGITYGINGGIMKRNGKLNHGSSYLCTVDVSSIDEYTKKMASPFRAQAIFWCPKNPPVRESARQASGFSSRYGTFRRIFMT